MVMNDERLVALTQKIAEMTEEYNSITDQKKAAKLGKEIDKLDQERFDLIVELSGSRTV